MRSDDEVSWIWLLVFLLAFLAACAPAPVVATATSEPTQTAVPTQVKPTATNTPEPTAVEELPSSDQEWLVNEIFPKAREVGCQPTFETSYYPEAANSIPWTVDEDGNMVQGLTELDFCGTAGQGPYIGFYVIGDGWNSDAYEPEAGPTYQLSADFVSDPTYAKYEGFLNAEDHEKMRHLVLCVGTELAHRNGAPDNYVSSTRPWLFVTSSQAFAEIFLIRWEPDDIEQLVGQCQ